jgi:plasmid stability protein
MRTTIELPDELLAKAKIRAASRGVSLKQFFIQAIEQTLAPEKPKVRRPPPAIGNSHSPKIGILRPEQIDEAMFG